MTLGERSDQEADLAARDHGRAEHGRWIEGSRHRDREGSVRSGGLSADLPFQGQVVGKEARSFGDPHQPQARQQLADKHQDGVDKTPPNDIAVE